MAIQGPSLEGTPPEGTPSTEINQPLTPEIEGLGNPFIQNIPESDRAIVAKYVNDWDAGVTKHIEKIRGEYEPYKNLGVDIETIQNAVWVMSQAESDPLEFFKNVRDRLIEMEYDLSEIETPGGGNQPPVGTSQGVPEFDGLPPQFVDRFTKLEGALEKVGKFMEDSLSERENASAQQQLDKILSDLENKHGKFDHPAVIARIINGMNPEDAIKDYKKAWESLNSPQKQTPPPVLGSGRTALDQVDASKMKNGQDRRSHIAEILRQAQT